jgi:UDP-N-acetylglucosamine acyltransferase
MPKIHKISEVSPEAQIADDVEIGPYCHIGPKVRIGQGTRIGSSVIIDGNVEIGTGNEILHHTVVGSPPQDTSWVRGTESFLRIGNNNVIHEYVTISPGTKVGTETVIGNNCMIMIGAHIAHNCRLGDYVVIVNYTALGGYTEIGDRAFLSAFVAIHQFCRIGRMAMIASFSKLAQDLPPFMTGQDAPTQVYGLNVVGMTRGGLSQETRNMVKKAYKLLYHDKYNFSDAVRVIEADPQLASVPEVMELCQFVKDAKRGICRHNA